MLEQSVLTCAHGDAKVMHCYSDGGDIGSLMVQLGLARAAAPYYAGEGGLRAGRLAPDTGHTALNFS
jgi:endonuclease YncB( thermonuclease family)